MIYEAIVSNEILKKIKNVEQCLRLQLQYTKVFTHVSIFKTVAYGNFRKKNVLVKCLPAVRYTTPVQTRTKHEENC